MSSAPRSPHIAVIVTTLGRPQLLDRLLLSLTGQTLPPAQVLVMDGGGDGRTRAVVERHAVRLPVRRTAAPHGTSAARNAGLVRLGVLDAAAVARPDPLGTLDAMLAGVPAVPPQPRRPLYEDVPLPVMVGAGGQAPEPESEPHPIDIVVFADENTWYPPDAFEAGVRVLAPPVDVLSGRMLDAEGDDARPGAGADGPGPLDARTVWTRAAIGACLFRTGFLRAVGGFDEGLGAGCDTPWQSGAETDLLLRGLRAGKTIVFDPEVGAFGHDPDAPGPAHHARARHDARGTGRVYRRYYDGYGCARVLVRPLGGAAKAAARGRWAESAWYLHKAIGRLEGMTGMLLPAPPQDAPRR
ncbi:glycosyltransferase family 2 protein [Actinomadura hibisca]|uniref:glycosyltransferase family 2 protein n=1 Tax=Actinomadura hibisca TaxID=68565 RepID=UPI00083039E2|nr:glycosyltransferase family 2 protein [Actinomadura hibisca]